MKKKKQKQIKRIDINAMELHMNGLFRMKVIPNKKKEQKNRKKFNINKEMNSYLNICSNCGDLTKGEQVFKQLFMGVEYD